jgi:hypothetical protein
LLKSVWLYLAVCIEMRTHNANYEAIIGVI